MFDFSNAQDFLAQSLPGMPHEAWWVAVFALAVLAAAAAIDTFKSIVPDPVIFVGIGVVTAAQGFYASWDFAALRLSVALFACIAIWAVNQVWYRFFKHDAIGMGDAKYTLLAVSAFGAVPALLAWGAGACLAVLWIMGLRIARAKISHVHFAPFLFVGLCAALWWLQTKV